MIFRCISQRKRLMSCGRTSVEGEAEEIADSPKPMRSRKRDEKRSNPFSSRGLDKFQIVYAELSARREYIAKETGVPGSMVRFTYSKNGWIPIVVRAREEIGKKNTDLGVARVSIPRPVENSNNNGEKDGDLTRKTEGNRIDGESEGISISVFDEKSDRDRLVMPWSRILKTTAFGVLGLSAIALRRSAIPAATAMAVGGVMCMKKFILCGLSYTSLLFRNPNTSQNRGENPNTSQNRGENPNTSQNRGGVEAIAEKKDIDNLSRITPRPGLAVSVIEPSNHIQPIEFLASPGALKPKEVTHEHRHHHHNKGKARTFRAVSIDNRPTRTARPQRSDSFYRRTRPAMAYDTNVDATGVIITLFFLAFYGRLGAIIFTCAWWYLLPLFGCHLMGE